MTAETRLEIEDLRFSYADSVTISGIGLDVKRGEFTGLIGPNGCGKSTLLKNIYRALVPDAGSIRLDGKDLARMRSREAALKLAVVGQENDVPFDFLVEEIVAMGRSPHKKLFEPDSAEDAAIARHALEHLGMESMAKRNYKHLSGGEKQRVLIARAIAQEADFLVLDEPANHLDISYQLKIFDFLKRRCAEAGLTVLAAIHDLNMAALYCDRIYVMKEGCVILSGVPEEILTPENIFSVFGVHCDTVSHPLTGRPVISYIPGSCAPPRLIRTE
jgi:iron complex transport system ATP-binding protein